MVEEKSDTPLADNIQKVIDKWKNPTPEEREEERKRTEEGQAREAERQRGLPPGVSWRDFEIA